MIKNIATWLRRVAQWLDPQREEITGYARKVVDVIPYYGIEHYRTLQMHGAYEEARIVKARMRQFAEISAMALLSENLNKRGVIRFEHNYGTQERVIDGIRCLPESVTVIIELQGSWS